MGRSVIAIARASYFFDRRIYSSFNESTHPQAIFVILILDFGSQYTQLIARRVREANVYCEIHPFSLGLEKIRALNPKGVILSGGPASVYQASAPKVNAPLFDLDVRFLGRSYWAALITLAA